MRSAFLLFFFLRFHISVRWCSELSFCAWFSWLNTVSSKLIPCCYKWWDAVIFSDWIVFHYWNKQVTCFSPSPFGGCAAWFWVLADVYIATVIMGVEISPWLMNSFPVWICCHIIRTNKHLQWIRRIQSQYTKNQYYFYVPGANYLKIEIFKKQSQLIAAF